MTLEDFVEPGLNYLESLFPRSCLACERRYATYAEFLEGTRRLGAMCYDIEISDTAVEPIGTLGFVHCACGSTISLSSVECDPHEYRRMLAFLRVLATSEDVELDVLLERLADMIETRALAARR